MTTANVLTQAIQMLGAGSQDSGRLSKLQTAAGSGTGGFEQIMSSSLKQTDKTSQAEAVKPANASQGKQFVAKKAVDKAETPSEPAKTGETQGEEITPEMAQKVEDAVKDMVKEELGLTEEELEAAMAVLGFAYADLLLPENMQALVLEVNQADSMELLTNETLNNQLAELLQGAEEILDEAGLTVPEEEIPKLLESLKNAASDQTQKAEVPQQEVAEEAGPKIEILADRNSPKMAEKTEQPEEAGEGEMLEEAVQKTENATADQTQKSTENDSSGQKESKSRQDSKGVLHEDNQNPLETVIQNLSKNASPESLVMTAAQRTEAMREIVNQVIDQIRISIKPETTSMEMTLNPENLGKVSLTVMAKDGHLTASFTAQNQVTKEALEGQMQTLKENLTSQGIKVDAIEVNIQSFAFDERNQMGSGQEKKEQSKSRERKLTPEDIANALGEDTDEEEALSTIPVNDSGGNVDYTA